MSKMTCMEAILEVLLDKTTVGLRHPHLDPILKGCMALATGESSEPDVIAWIVAHDKNRTEEEICKDVCIFLRETRYPLKTSSLLAEAVAAGKAAF